MMMNGMCSSAPPMPGHDVLAGVVDRHDRGVVQAGRRLRLAPEPGLERGVAGQVGPQHLDRHLPSEPHVAAGVHDGHAAAPEQVADLVAPGEHALIGAALVVHWSTPPVSSPLPGLASLYVTVTVSPAL